MPNECWRKIQQRQIVITHKDDIMTCVQENNLFGKSMHSSQKGYVYWQIQRNSFFTLTFEYVEELPLFLFFRTTFSTSYPF